MELTMAAQEDSTPWSVPLTTSDSLSAGEAAESLLRGRGYFSELGTVRRKPGILTYQPLLEKAPDTYTVSTPRRPTNILQILLRQTGSQTMHFNSILYCFPPNLPPERVYPHSHPPYFPVFGGCMRSCI